MRKTKLTLTADDRWLLRLLVLTQAAGRRVSVEKLLSEFKRRKIGGVTALKLRAVMRALVRNGLLALIRDPDDCFYEATSLGRETASTTRVRLSKLLTTAGDSLPT